ncbi:MAG: WG repeat-containing protein [Bergeyella sp.]
MKKIFGLLFIFFAMILSAQSKTLVKKAPAKKTPVRSIPKPDLEKLDESLPDLIPQRFNGKLGFVNQKGKVIIPHQYNFGTFFWEDCNLLNSPNEALRKFGTADYASVTEGDKDYRISKTGKRVYTFKQEDLGKCESTYQEKKYYPYMYRGFFGIVDKTTFVNEQDYRQYQVYPQYQYLYVMESDDLDNPMIIASRNDAFGVIDKYNNVVIPFEYTDIKRNFSWKMGKMFEVTKDGKNYFFIDSKNKVY